MATLRDAMLRDLQLRGLSARTQEAYLRAVRQLAEFYRRPPDQLKEEEVRDYFLHLKNHKKFAPSSLKIAHVGIRFFYTHTVKRDWSTLALIRAERQRRLPDVLTLEEVHAIIRATRTVWNRAYLWTVYSCGLRLHESLHLQVADIDPGAPGMMVHVHRGKGAKDRYVPLPASTLAVLRDYWKTHRNPVWLFPAHGRNHKLAATADHPMLKSSVQMALKRVVKELGLKKQIRVHTLRHSYATHRRVMHAIEHCRDGTFGHAVYHCDGCNATHHVPRSCGNRHCPTCQQHKVERWLGRELDRLLPCEYFLATFTVRPELQRLVRSHAAVAYRLMFQAAVAALTELAADPRHIGAVRLGLLAVLHTWGRALDYHPHIHVIVPAGGLADDGTWRASRPSFFLPVRALSVLFSKKLRDLLKQAGLGGSIDGAVWTRPWVVHVQPAGDGRHALRYLARYVFRVAISNSRIVSCDDGRVVFRYRPTRSAEHAAAPPNRSGTTSGRRWRTMSLDAFEFIRRFLQHVLPRGFQKVRHYGFLSLASRQSIADVRRLVEDFTFQTTLTATALAAAPALRRPVTCPRCGGAMRLECLVLANGRRWAPRRPVLRSTRAKRRAGSATDST